MSVHNDALRLERMGEKALRGVWTSRALRREGINMPDTQMLEPLVQETSFGYVQIHAGGAATALWRDGTSRVCIRLLATRMLLARKLDGELPPSVASDERAAATVAADTQRLPTDLKPCFVHLAHCLQRLHAHTPLVKWIDAQGSAEAAAWFPAATHCRALGAVYSAQRDAVPDYELRIHAVTTNKPACHDDLCVRVERERNQLLVQRTTCDPMHGLEHASSTVRLYVKNTAVSTLDEYERWAAVYAKKMAFMADTLRSQAMGQAVFKHTDTAAVSATAIKPHTQYTQMLPPLSSARRADLHARERAWYKRSHTWPFA